MLVKPTITKASVKPQVLKKVEKVSQVQLVTLWPLKHLRYDSRKQQFHKKYKALLMFTMGVADDFGRFGEIQVRSGSLGRYTKSVH